MISFSLCREIITHAAASLAVGEAQRSPNLGTASLPPPPNNFKVQAITLGRGIQNYTCESNSTAPPKPIGAIATLYDATPFLSFLPTAEGDDLLALLPSFLVSLNPDNLNSAFLPVQGHHWFDAKGTPVFDLGELGFFKGKKNANISAPHDSFKGPYNQGVGAVDWLKLCPVPGTYKLNRTYRVETAGGKPPATCEGQPEAIQVEYAAQYWFF